MRNEIIMALGKKMAAMASSRRDSESSVPRVLFVDDEQLLVNVYLQALQHACDLSTATTGFEAIETIRDQGPFSVIITDQRMPLMDGMEFIARAREIAPEAVYVMLTGVQTNRLRDYSSEEHLFRTLCKPCTIVDLKQAIHDAHQHYLAQQDLKPAPTSTV